MVRIDMSEYMEKHAVSRLIGAPPGYIGYEEGGVLTEAVRRRPYSVILLDEVEKAHPDVFNVFLQVFDDGRITDGQGRTVDFKNTIIIMTSNIGSHTILDETDPEKMNQLLMDQLETRFRPEFLNRIDDIVTFTHLEPEHLEQILDLQLDLLNSRLAEKELKLELSTSAKKLVSEWGYDREYGARPLKRVFQKQIQNPLSVSILEGRYAPGDTIRVDAKGQELVFK